MTSRSALVLDTSVLVALALVEPEAGRLRASCGGVARRFASSASLVEARLVLQKHVGPEAGSLLDGILADLEVRVVPVSTELARIAQEAAMRYGKGFAVPGVLNFGDTFSYALSVWLGVPLLFKGNDFSRTDVEIAAW